MGVSWRECGGGVSWYSRVGGFELLIQLESLKPWPETSKPHETGGVPLKVIARLDHKYVG